MASRARRRAATLLLRFRPRLRDERQGQGAVIKQLARQSPPRRPRVRLGVVAVEAVRVLHRVPPVDGASARDVEFVFEDGGGVVHPLLLQAGALDEAVGLGVVCDDPPGVSCDRGRGGVRRERCLGVTVETVRRMARATGARARFPEPGVPPMM